MEPDVIRLYSSSPPPMEDGAEEEDEFGDFDTFSNVPHSISFTEFETPATFNQNEAFSATSPPELLNSRGVTAFSHSSSNGTHNNNNELSKANGVVPGSHLGPSERTEIKKVLSGSVDFSVSDTAGSEPAGCNGGGSEVLTNGFATFDVQGSPSAQDSVHSCKKATSTEDTGSIPAEDDFADFAAFSNPEGHRSQTANEDSDNPPGGSLLAEAACHEEHFNMEPENTSEDRDTNRTGPDTCGSDSGPAEAPDGSCNTDRGPHSDPGPAEAPDGLCNTDRGPHSDSGPPAAPDGSCNTDRGPHSDPAPAEAPDGSCNTDRGPHSDSEQRDVAFAQEASEAVCTNRPLTLNGVDVADGDDSRDGGSEDDLSPDAEEGQSDGKGSGNEMETETETETSLGRPLSTEALEEFGDISTTGSVPSLPLLGETAATPADYSQLAEDEDFGDFGDAGSFSGQGFADFEQLDVQQEPSRTESPAPAQEATNTEEVEEVEQQVEEVEDDFGDFNSPKFHASGTVGEEDGGKFADFPVSDSFGNFSSAAEAADGEADAGWSAFGDQQVEEEESWAAFSEEPSIAPPAESRTEEEEEEEEEWHESEVPAVSEETSRTDRQAHAVILSEHVSKWISLRVKSSPCDSSVNSLSSCDPPDDPE
ncbi:aftiphilin-like [Notothenia coriiceps]|uniref:Aftiphilin-like n=1 Tax=Notothenia coriiceps TaxID=8208 RepID=A0A6I9N8R5_9TELE|nr:PREDICTED: aftiphilin-like [Notothenia coriiceps]